MPLPAIQSQEPAKDYARFEPYFVARKKFLPRFGDAMVPLLTAPCDSWADECSV